MSRALEETILRDPTDEDAWLVWGDWLKERGDPRGDVILLGDRLREDDALASAYAEAYREACWPKGSPRPRAHYRALFHHMVETLRARREIEVYEVVVEAPATDLSSAERALGQPLPEDLRAFWEQANGVFLEWGLRRKKYKRTAPFDFPDYGNPPGCVNLLSVDHAISPDWSLDMVVNNITPEEQRIFFGVPLKNEPPFGAVVLDNFSRYNHADLVIGPEPVVIVSTDHGADMASSDFCSFATYLDATLALFGTNRYAALGTGLSRAPARVESWTRWPSLSEIIAKLG